MKYLHCGMTLVSGVGKFSMLKGLGHCLGPVTTSLCRRSSVLRFQKGTEQIRRGF